MSSASDKHPVSEFLPRFPQIFQCPDQDKQGFSLTAHEITGASKTTVVCTYDGGTGECTYDGDGSLLSGSSNCPDGPQAGDPSSPTQIITKTQVVTSTQTQSQTLADTTKQPTNSAPSLPPTSPPAQPLSSASSVPTAPSLSAFSSSSVANAGTGASSSSSTSTAAGVRPTDTGLIPIGTSLGHSLPASTTAGIIIGTLLFLLLLLVVVILRRRRNRRAAESAMLRPISFLIPSSSSASAAGENGNRRAIVRGLFGKKGRSRRTGVLGVATTSPNTRAREGPLVAVRKEAEADMPLSNAEQAGGSDLNLAAQNEALRERIRLLEDERMGMEGEAPPAYLES
ncbi:hypothetical protein R3P38DRAFT_3349970 [Favolaschia claudopus]|uniref:Uncharacterized protein n=1 Tax=Favolaschia claudopus TaxID=2862362 RepID=A0AAW0CLV8_9AGAR